MGLREAWRGLLGRETKASRAMPLLALQQPGRAVWSPRRFDSFADEAYRKNIIAYRAITLVTRAAASVPWRLVRRARGAVTAVADHAVLDLLRRPNPTMAQSEFVEAVTGYLLIAGNSFVEAVVGESGAGESGARELWPLRPDRVKVIAGPAGLPQGYVFSVGGAERRWDADPLTGRSLVLHLRTFNPLDDWYGMSPIEAAAFAIDQRNESDKWNMALLQNGARPSGAMVYEPREGATANLSDAQFARLKDEIAQQYGGARNAGRPMLLDGGLRWQEMSLSPKDMDFLESRNAASRDVAQAFGVPAQLLGIPGDNTYSNYQEARLAFWEDTVVPLLRHLSDEFNGWLVPMFADDVMLEIDLDEVPALALRREKVWQRLRDADFLTVNEKHRAAGFAPIARGDELAAPAPPGRRETGGRGGPRDRRSG